MQKQSKNRVEAKMVPLEVAGSNKRKFYSRKMQSIRLQTPSLDYVFPLITGR